MYINNLRKISIEIEFPTRASIKDDSRGGLTREIEHKRMNISIELLKNEVVKIFTRK